MRRLATSTLLLFALVLIPLGVVYAQTYAFTVLEERVDAYWESDGTLTLEYEYVFDNASYADPIDYVDIGLPNDSYFISNVSASVDGQQIFDITESPYVDTGVALGLGSNSIRPGDRGTVRMTVTGLRDVLYTDNLDDSYASAVFAPNYFGSEFVVGNTDITVVYHLPPGVDPSEPKWHPSPDGFGEQPITGFDSQDRITYTWRNINASASEFYLFGASFPKTYVPSSTITEPDFFQRTGIDPDFLIPFLLCCCFAIFFGGLIYLGVVSERRRRMQYLPPKIAIEGHGIKRGLTAPEAAILLEQPMDKILSMILFSVIKKNAARVVTPDPIELDVVSPIPTDLHEYEAAFLEAFAEKETPKRRRALQQMMVTLVKGVANKMRGFSKRETLDFYRTISEEAWQQVQAAGTPKLQGKMFGDQIEWTMLDKDYDRRTMDTFGGGQVYAPSWWGRYNPTHTTMRSAGSGRASGGGSPSRSTGGGSVLPTLPGGDFAASVTQSVQNFAGGVIGNLSDFTGGVTKVTNPPPPPSKSGSFSGGGSSCACACAGCACACAGGGR
jgi:hypothetical protein